jgi:hypothetical protein
MITITLNLKMIFLLQDRQGKKKKKKKKHYQSDHIKRLPLMFRILFILLTSW